MRVVGTLAVQPLIPPLVSSEDGCPLCLSHILRIKSFRVIPYHSLVPHLYFLDNSPFLIIMSVSLVFTISDNIPPFLLSIACAISHSHHSPSNASISYLQFILFILPNGNRKTLHVSPLAVYELPSDSWLAPFFVTDGSGGVNIVQKPPS
jgi:hypothetical protein